MHRFTTSGNLLSRIRSRLLPYKAAVYRSWFRVIESRRAYPVIAGRRLQSLRGAVLRRVEFSESICNAGMVGTDDGYMCVAKNQRFSLAISHSQSSKSGLSDEEKLLYLVNFDHQWQLTSCNSLNVFVDGALTCPSSGVEDVRLLRYAEGILAYATNRGNRRSAWPLLGALEGVDLILRSIDAPYAAPQKNWMPFVFDGVIYLEHSIHPRIVLRYCPESTSCELAGSASLDCSHFDGLEIHGGAPAVRINDRYFLGVGNSQRRFWYQERYYAPMFYLFEARPPFRIVRVSKPVRLASRLERVQYVCGMALNQDRRMLTLSYGVSDYDNHFVEVPLDVVIHLLDGLELIN